MGKCSYTLYDWKCPESTWKGSEEYCIFHDPSPEKDIELFKQKLKKKLDKKDYEFRGYYFLEDVNFHNWKFEEDSDFSEATFQNVDFSEATFQNAYFFRATFQKDAYFFRATFQKDAYFFRATFKNVDFRGATFQNVDFRGATIRENFDFTPKFNKKINLSHMKFLSKSYITADLTETIFYRAELENVAFIDCLWPKRIYEEVHMDDEKLTFKELETIYRDLKQNMQRHGDYRMEGIFFYREMEMRRKGAETKRGRLWLKLYYILAGYGENPERIALSAFVTVLSFAFLYWVLGCLQYPVRNPTLFQQAKDAIYFSFVTFTTLGLGDIHPVNDIGKILVCFEAVIGLFLVVLFGGVFQKKMMR